MGQKLSRSVSWAFGSGNSGNKANVDEPNVKSGFSIAGPSPFVLTRRGSMFLDQDGDIAHEFYEQVKVGDRYVMKKCETNLKPQGEVELPHPRLRCDLPFVMVEVTSR